MDPLEIRIARVLAEWALKPGGGRITYPRLADEIEWYNNTGQGLGRPLTGVLRFCRERNLPIITSIVCATGTAFPSARGIQAMRLELDRDIDLVAEQDAVFAFDWTSVPEFGLTKANRSVDFGKLFATAVDFFEPEQCGILATPSWAIEGLGPLAGRDVYLILYSDPRRIPHRHGIGGADNGRLLGIAAVSPLEVSVPGAVAPEFAATIGLPLGELIGPLIKRAWRFEQPPLYQSALPDVFRLDMPSGASALSEREKGEIAQRPLFEVPVFSQPSAVFPYLPPDPALHTYMVICNERLATAGIPVGENDKLVKIGVSNDRDRRLLELNGNHIAVIFGVRFVRYSDGTWPSQAKALEVERLAHEWCHRHARHASGEYFWLKEDQLLRAGAIVRTGKM